MPKSLRDFLGSARSDQLPWLNQYLAPIARQLAVLGVGVELRMVVDSSQLIADVRWLAKAKNPQARTALQEAASAGVVRLFAPRLVVDEVDRRIAELGEDGSVDGKRARHAWLRYQESLCLLDHSPATGEAADILRERDPSDLPFIGAFEAIGAAGIVTRDPDLLENPVATFSSRIEIDLRNYARSKAVQLNIFFFGYFSVALTAKAVEGLIRLLGRAVYLLNRLPTWAKLIAIAGCALALSKREWRESIKKFLADRKTDFAGRLEPIQEQLTEIWDLAMAEHAIAEKAAAEIAAKTPPSGKLRLRQAINLVFATTEAPLLVEVIEQRVREVGYVSNATNLKPSIKRYLRSEPRFIDGSSGWTMTREYAST